MRAKRICLVLSALLAIAAAVAPPLSSRAAETIPHTPAAGAIVTPTLGMALLAAYVNSDGTLARGAGATGATEIATGFYEVDFNRDVSACFYSATSDESSPRFVVAQPMAGNVNGVFMQFQDPNGDSQETAFYLMVFCAK
jgi:hypothetical protein